MLTHAAKQRGISLVELLIAGVIALIALSAVLTVYSVSARHSSQLLQRAHLHQQLHGLLQLISTDLRRAGYWHFNPARRAPTENPFQDATNQIRVLSYPGESRNSCILFAYDLDQDGLVGVGNCDEPDCGNQTDSDNVEQFGYRLQAGRVQSRYGGSDLSCASGYWQTVNDPSVEITHLKFIPQVRCLNLLESEKACVSEFPHLIQRALQVQIGGHLHEQSDTHTLINRWVRVRNDQLEEGEQ